MRRRPLVVRRAGAPLIRGAVAGGAGYLAGRAAAGARQHERAQDDRTAAAAAPAREAAPTPEDLITHLNRLADLKDAGLLTDEEFALAKQKLLTARQ